jgi:F0F1-type ATP synthase delta subunit
MLKKQVEDTEAAAAHIEQVGEEREKILVEAKKEGDKIVAQAYERVEAIKSDASEEAKKIIQKAQVDAKEAELVLFEGVRDKVAALAIAATQKLLDASLDESRQRALIDEFFSSVKDGKVVVLVGEDIQGKSAVVTSALPLKDKEKAIIKKDILKRTAGDTEVVFAVNPDILGGLSIRIGDKVFDHSISSQLAGLRSRFS